MPVSSASGAHSFIYWLIVDFPLVTNLKLISQEPLNILMSTDLTADSYHAVHRLFTVYSIVSILFQNI